MLTIIHNVKAIEHYPFEAMDEAVLSIFRDAKNSLRTKGDKKNFDSLLRLFECFLQITGRQLSEMDLSGSDFERTCKMFLGALHSKSFIDYPRQTTYGKSHSWLNLLSVAAETKVSLVCVNIKLSTVYITEEVQSCIDLFNRETLVEEKVWLWRGWQSTNRNGDIQYFPLLPVYNRLGRVFTQQFYAVCDQYYGTGKGNNLPFLKSLTDYMGAYPAQLSPFDFQNPEFVGRFWSEFFAYYVTTGFADGNGSRVSTLIADWRYLFTPFVKCTLIPSGLFAEQWGEFPSPEPRRVYGSRTRLVTQEDGTVVKTKLLTYVPLHISDEDAITRSSSF